MKFFAIGLAALAFAFPVLAESEPAAELVNRGLPDISKLSSCALQCVFAATKAVPGCNNPLDPKCVCNTGYINSASNCLLAKCPHKDIVPTLGVARQMCPDLGLPDLGTLPDCAFECVISSLQGANCAGPLDKQCICGIPFGLKATTCLGLKCKLAGTGPALQLQLGICRPANKPTCAATGLWQLTDIRCLLPHAGPYTKRSGTPAAVYYRSLLEAGAEAEA